MVAVSLSRSLDVMSGDRPLAPPAWIRLLLGEARVEALDGGVILQQAPDGAHVLASFTVEDASLLSAARFQEATTDAYRRLHEALSSGPARELVRVWNFIPGILEPLDDLAQRYMAFNAGRFAAYAAWYPGDGGFESRIATASGVGHGGRHLAVHALAGAQPGEPVENPRQVPSYRYSSRYGPRPPCFSRATRVLVPGARSPWLLVGGTASICGEDTRYVEDLEAQLAETLENLRALVRRGLLEAAGAHRADEPLAGFRHLRVYHPCPEHGPWIRSQVQAAFPALENLEFIRAELCRPGLLVEIEGVASLD